MSPAKPHPARTMRDLVVPALFLLLLCVPIGANLLGVQLLPRGSENRNFTPYPAWPRSWAEFLALPGRLTAAANDRFGLRSEMLWLDGRLRYQLFREAGSDQVLFGRHKRLFLTSHAKGLPFSLIENICGADQTPQRIAASASSTAQLLDDATRLAPLSVYVSIPTAPVLYPEDLPPWLAARCRSFDPTAAAVRDALAAARPDLRARFMYALEPMQAAKAAGEAIPRNSFHWHGLGSKLAVEAIAERGLGMTKLRDIPTRPVLTPSDLSQFIPGLALRDRGLDPDYAAAGIAPCFGAACMPELAPFAFALPESSRFRAGDGRGKRLLLISDSFGLKAAGWFGEYFADVIHLNFNYRALQPDQAAGLRAELLRDFKADALVMLFHDGAISVTALLDSDLFGRH